MTQGVDDLEARICNQELDPKLVEVEEDLAVLVVDRDPVDRPQLAAVEQRGKVEARVGDVRTRLAIVDDSPQRSGSVRPVVDPSSIRTVTA